jgi:AbrB family looped-hinge helix DNA binding protein
MNSIIPSRPILTDSHLYLNRVFKLLNISQLRDIILLVRLHKVWRSIMAAIETTKMSSKGQIVIPEDIRNKLGLKTGDKFLVMGDKDVVILKALSNPSLEEFDDLIKAARRQARTVGLKRSDIANAISKSRR